MWVCRGNRWIGFSKGSWADRLYINNTYSSQLKLMSNGHYFKNKRIICWRCCIYYAYARLFVSPWLAISLKLYSFKISTQRNEFAFLTKNLLIKAYNEFPIATPKIKFLLFKQKSSFYTFQTIKCLSARFRKVATTFTGALILLKCYV